MPETSERFNEKGMFTYNKYKKLGTAIAIYTLIVIGVLFSAYYFFFLKTSDILFVRILNSIFGHVSSNIKSFTLLGGFYSTLFGGLFFIPVPIEAIYVGFLKAGQNVFFITLMFLTGLVIAYWVNYHIGFWLSGMSKKLIGVKTFYKTKIVFNKYGPFGIFVFNALPLPSQPLCAILGVFNYNRKKFWFYTMLGQVMKYLAMIMGYFYIT